MIKTKNEVSKKMNLGDGFARRKQIDAEITKWISRLSLAGQESKRYRTKTVEKTPYVEIPGSIKQYLRTYTIEECTESIDQLIKEDKELALRISRTNQIAKAKLIDLDGTELNLSIPELLVLRNEIAPKYENKVRTIPKRTTGVDIVSTEAKVINWRSVIPKIKIKEELSSKGHKIQNEYIDYYEITEVKDWGFPERDLYDEVDKIHSWMVRIREAINQANKTELVEL